MWPWAGTEAEDKLAAAKRKEWLTSYVATSHGLFDAMQTLARGE